MDKREYDRAVRRAARQLIRGVLTQDADEAGAFLVRSREELLLALGLRDAWVMIDSQQFVHRATLALVGNEVLTEARRQLFADVLPHCDLDLRADLAGAFDQMQKKFCEF